MGPSLLSGEQLAAWYHANAPAGYRASVPVEDLARIYVWEGALEGVRGDIAFMQGVLETGWFRWPGGSVRPEMNNFAGMGATDVNPRPASYPDASTGVRAQIQHLRRYADPTCTSPEALHLPLVDGRFDLVTPPGKAPRWSQFGNGIWASSTNRYGGRILDLYAAARAHARI